MTKQIAIIGSTGSIGTQALEVIRQNSDKFEVYALTANNNVDLLIQQAKEFKPDMVVIANESLYPKLKEALKDLPIKVWAGQEAISQVVVAKDIDLVLTALVGFAGLKPTIKAIEAGKTIALANKETLVVAGEMIMNMAIKHKSAIIPVDSEHSAIFQCLVGEYNNPIEKIILTASGGPFREYTKKNLQTVTREQALRHPNWAMGAKITIDSASMMNKGLEMIEAKWLFDVEPKQIDILVHPQSIIHSMVQFEDGSIKAQLGLPDMRLPIQYALAFPHRIASTFERLDFKKISALRFEEADTEKFPNLAFAFDAIAKGGNMPCILNAANEIAVAAFLDEKIKFMQMSDVIEKTMSKANFIALPNYDDYVQTDAQAREIAYSLSNH